MSGNWYENVEKNGEKKTCHYNYHPISDLNQTSEKVVTPNACNINDFLGVNSLGIIN